MATIAVGANPQRAEVRVPPTTKPFPNGEPVERRAQRLVVGQRLRFERREAAHPLGPGRRGLARDRRSAEVPFGVALPDCSIGNVRSGSFRTIWTGEKAAAFRHKLSQEPLPICARCCGSFVYGRWKRPSPPKSFPVGHRPLPVISRPSP